MSKIDFSTVFHTYKKQVFFLVVTLAFGFIAIQGIKATVNEIIAKNDAIAKAQERFERLSDKETLLKSEDRQRLRGETVNLDKAIPSVIDLPLILTILQKTASETGVTLGDLSLASNTQAIAILPIDKAEKLSSFQFSVNLSGSFEGIEGFAEKLGNISPMQGIANITFAADKAKIVVSFYFQPRSLKTKLEPDEPLVVLTNDHKKTIEEVLQLEISQPDDSNAASPSAQTQERENPFR